MRSKLKISAFISVIGCIDDVILIIIPTVIFMTMFKQEMDLTMKANTSKITTLIKLCCVSIR